MPPVEYNASVVQRVEVAPGLIILRVVPDSLPLRFEAGQYTVLGLKRSAPRVIEGTEETEHTGADEPPIGSAGDGARTFPGSGGTAAENVDPERMIRRAYSIASSSRSQEFLEFYVTLVASGELTPRLFALKLKDRLYVGPKATGLFTLDRVPEGHHVLLVATGTGLAPYMSMLRSELVCGGPRRFVVLHGARFSWDLGYRAELGALIRHCPNLTYLPVISRPREDPSWVGLGGYLQDVLVSGVIEERTGIPLDPRHLHVFLCGNPSMIEDSKARLLALGFVADKGKDVGSLHTEEYW